jgi:hypothetical protein
MLRMLEGRQCEQSHGEGEVGAQQLHPIELRRGEATPTRFSRLWPHCFPNANGEKGRFNLLDFTEEVQ